MAAYTVLADAVAFVNSLTQITGRDAIVTQLLTDSAGTLTESKIVDGSLKPAGTTIYRVYFCASTLIKTDKDSQTIKSADGVEFSNTGATDPNITMNLPALIAGWMDMQLRLDQSLQLTVPDGFAAVLSLVGGPVMSIIVGP